MNPSPSPSGGCNGNLSKWLADEVRNEINMSDGSQEAITEHVKFDTGNLCMVTDGGKTGRVGIIQSRDRHPGSFDIVHVKVSIFLSQYSGRVKVMKFYEPYDIFT